VPLVSEAVAAFDAGDAASASQKLEEYLSTGPCKDGSIGTPDFLKQRPDGTFDLGLALFRLGEQLGRRFGEEEIDAGASEQARALRHAQVVCGGILVQGIADDRDAPPDLRARASYLHGNLEFLDGEYEQAVRDYDRALVVVPGVVDAGDSLGRDAAWNRAIALRRIEDKKDAGSDAGSDASSDASRDSGGDSGDHRGDAGQEGGGPNRPDASDEQDRDAAPRSPPPDAAPPPTPDAGAPPPPRNEDERMLDQLENAPTLQQEEAKRFGKKRVHGMADK